MSTEATTPSAPRVAVVTGGSRGIGRATVSRLAAEGCAIVIGYAGNRDLAEAAVEEVTAAGGRAVAVRADVADERQVAELFGTAAAEFGGVDVVVHAAGRMYLAPIAELELAELDALHRTNIRGTFVVAREAARTLRRGGSFVAFSTSVVALAFPEYGAYSASKGAVEGRVSSLLVEERKALGESCARP
ncbi:SDR family NAD(P)-dependent oxidoreductase, partial [Streptomyces sp. NPDC002586]